MSAKINSVDSAIKQIISDAIWAPSGENCQPWKFVVDRNNIRLFNLPERDQSAYSWGQRASYMANGACLENFCISAQHLGYKPEVSLLSNVADENLVADINLSAADIKESSLYKFIKLRSTNRKPYGVDPLPPEQVKEIMESVNGYDVDVYITQENDKKITLGRVGALNEEVMLSNEYLHRFFFSHVNWTREEDERKKVGFFIDTLELPGPATLAFRLFRHWKIIRFLNKFGMNKMVGKQNARTNSLSAGFGVIVIKGKTPKDFVIAGRALQRIWLTATKFNLSLQPLTGILFLMHKISAGQTMEFTEKQIKTIKAGYRVLCREFNIEGNDTVAFMFRLGVGGSPSARSVRFNVDEVTETVK